MMSDPSRGKRASGQNGSNGGSTSHSLLADARRSVPAAWERLVRLYAPLVASWCRRQGVREQDIGDVLQEVFMAVATHMDRFRGDRPADTFRGWLATITRNKIRDHFRRRSAELPAAGGSEAAAHMRLVPDTHVSEKAEDDDVLWNDLLRRALESIRTEFHERTWQAFWGSAVQGRSAPDVAADLAMQPGAVRVAKSRVLLRLRQELGEA